MGGGGMIKGIIKKKINSSMHIKKYLGLLLAVGFSIPLVVGAQLPPPPYTAPFVMNPMACTNPSSSLPRAAWFFISREESIDSGRCRAQYSADSGAISLNNWPNLLSIRDRNHYTIGAGIAACQKAACSYQVGSAADPAYAGMMTSGVTSNFAPTAIPSPASYGAPSAAPASSPVSAVERAQSIMRSSVAPSSFGAAPSATGGSFGISLSPAAPAWVSSATPLNLTLSSSKPASWKYLTACGYAVYTGGSPEWTVVEYISSLTTSSFISPGTYSYSVPPPTRGATRFQCTLSDGSGNYATATAVPPQVDKENPTVELCFKGPAQYPWGNDPVMPPNTSSCSTYFESPVGESITIHGTAKLGDVSSGLGGYSYISNGYLGITNASLPLSGAPRSTTVNLPPTPLRSLTFSYKQNQSDDRLCPSPSPRGNPIPCPPRPSACTQMQSITVNPWDKASRSASAVAMITVRFFQSTDSAGACYRDPNPTPGPRG